MTFLQVSFYFFAVVLIGAAACVVTIRNPVKAALFLVLGFFSAACIWITLEAEFLAIVLVLVYVGAVMVLFLFVIMMLDIDVALMREGFTQYLPLGAVVAVLMVIELGIVLTSGNFGLESMPRPIGHDSDYSNTRELGLLIYTDYVYAFELSALLLLVAIVAAIVLTLRRRPMTLYQSPEKQVRVTKAERLRVIQMSSESHAKPEKGGDS